MIEAIVIKHLSGLLEVPVYAERPEEPDDFYILVEKTGSRERNLIERSVIAIQSYAPSLLEAAQLNRKVIGAMKALIEDDRISSCRKSSDYNFTDTETKSYRYQAVYEITHD